MNVEVQEAAEALYGRDRAAEAAHALLACPAALPGKDGPEEDLEDLVEKGCIAGEEKADSLGHAQNPLAVREVSYSLPGNSS